MPRAVLRFSYLFFAIRTFGGGAGSAAFALSLALLTAEASARRFTAVGDMSSGILGILALWGLPIDHKAQTGT